MAKNKDGKKLSFYKKMRKKGKSNEESAKLWAEECKKQEVTKTENNG